MKKILLLLAIVLPFVLSSCSDDKDEPKDLEQALIGEWAADLGGDYSIHYLFNEPKTGIYWEIDNGMLVEGTYQFIMWDLDGKNLTVTSEHMNITTKISIKKDILHMDYLLQDFVRVE